VSIGNVLAESLRVYRGMLSFLPFAALVFAPLDLIDVLITDPDIDPVLYFAFAPLSVALLSIGYAWVEGAVIAALAGPADVSDPASLAGSFSRIRAYLPALLIANVLASFGVTLGLILLVIPGLFLATRWSLVLPPIVIERLSWREAFSRSAELVGGNGWRVFFVVVLLVFVYLGLRSPLLWRADFFSIWIVNVIADALMAVFYGVVATVMYHRLRGGWAAAAA
jgi:hypothetical protein